MIFKQVIFNTKTFNDCLIAINKQGIYFLANKTLLTLFHFKLNEIISTRRYRNNTEENNNAAFIDIKTGDLIQQQIIKIQTDYV